MFTKRQFVFDVSPSLQHAGDGGYTPGGICPHHTSGLCPWNQMKNEDLEEHDFDIK